jgi:hypothetical protein
MRDCTLDQKTPTCTHKFNILHNYIYTNILLYKHATIIVAHRLVVVRADIPLSDGAVVLADHDL